MNIDYLSDDLIEKLRDRKLQWFLAPKELNSSSYNQYYSNNQVITLVIYENERWSSIANQWGNVLKVHLKSGDLKPFTDESGKNSLGYR